LESIRNDIERTFGSMKQHLLCIVNPLTLQEAHILEQLFKAWCVLHNLMLDYNGADDWTTRVKYRLSCEKIENEDVVTVDNDFSYVRTNHQNDDEWIIILDMESPSPDSRSKARHFVNDEISKVEMMARLNNMHNYFFYVVASTKNGKVICMCDIKHGL
jgi:hypothetical protein